MRVNGRGEIEVFKAKVGERGEGREDVAEGKEVFLQRERVSSRRKGKGKKDVERGYRRRFHP